MVTRCFIFKLHHKLLTFTYYEFNLDYKDKCVFKSTDRVHYWIIEDDD